MNRDEMLDRLRDQRLAPPESKRDDRPRHITIELDPNGPGYLVRYCSTPNCRVESDARTDCCQDACPHCGSGGETFSADERGDVTRYSCAECETQWRS